VRTEARGGGAPNRAKWGIVLPKGLVL
jgi:hypothetical protein